MIHPRSGRDHGNSQPKNRVILRTLSLPVADPESGRVNIGSIARAANPFNVGGVHVIGA
jgi:hypothetical protein